ncbi:glycoside hydrolase family 43 protein [Aliifodinibius salicampi]|uniref:Glycoside hydrolase family 43 protein n=1 Tax=Fodinibius salicampi TaxID=1920655 RepID=A0ABT3PZM3_9BACT|nr:glycoside hydrolase family 43 protein [Fodinibius salicampi]MCW9713314.1 glycoside hydrolase family 43 protein [Fodinibius salicampi]
MFKKSLMLLPAFLLLMAGQVCSQDLSPSADNPPDTDQSDATVSDPKFDWYKYVGNDPIYRDLSVGQDEYINPINSGFYPDPSITRAGDDYYMVHSSFSYYPGIPIFHSKDLINWEQIGHVLDRPSQLQVDGLGISEGVFAPTIEYNDGTFYVVNTIVGGGGNFIVTTDDPAGDWSDPMWLNGVGGIDPSLFFDDDGTTYILNNDAPEGEPLYQGHRAIWIRPYDLEANQPAGEAKVIVNGGVDISEQPIWIEGPHMMKVNGEYILHNAEGGTGPQHSQVVFKGDDPMGPFEPWDQNPILTQRHISPNREFPVEYVGHADMVETQNGEWWAIFLGVRPYDGSNFNTGRETFLLPVTWTEDNWPTILDYESKETVPVKLERPDLPLSEEPVPPNNGNFTYTDDFESPELADYWTMIRTPQSEWWNISDDGQLEIESRSEIISGRGNPSFIGKRQKNAYATVSTKMTFDPKVEGNVAGLVAFQGENYYYLLGVTANEEGQYEIYLEKSEGNQKEIIASEVIEDNPDNKYYLKIQARGAEYDFSYGIGEDDWQPLYQGADGTILSTTKAGGFVGTVIGMYAYTPE